MKSKIKFTLFAAALAFAFVGGWVIMPAQTRAQPASAATSDKYDGDCQPDATVGRCADKPFDHSFCQYPDRSTNPADGCDNSDPCDPANVKGGSGDCTPTSTVPVTPAATNPNQCGGK